MKSSQKGQSLILVMIGLSIVSVILLAVFKLLDMSRDMAASFQNVIKAMDAMQEVRFALADVATCNANLRGLTPGTRAQPFDLPNRLYYVGAAAGPGAPMDTAVEGVPTQGFNPETVRQEIIAFGGSGESSISVSRVFINFPDTATPNVVEINVEMVHRGIGSNVQKLKTRAVPVWVKLDAAGRISCCNTRNILLCP